MGDEHSFWVHVGKAVLSELVDSVRFDIAMAQGSSRASVGLRILRYSKSAG